MELDKLTKNELFIKCQELNITKYKSKTKSELIEMINKKNSSKENQQNMQNNKLIVLKHLKPLVKWSGGKNDEIKLFEKYFPKDYKTYIEPFVGGGSVFFYINSHTHNVISDIHTELIDFYKSIGNGNGKEIYDFMKNSPNDETTYYKIRDELKINNELDNAKRFYYQRKTCFRCMYVEI